MLSRIKTNTRIAMLGHADGVSHVYTDSSANAESASKIAVDAKPTILQPAMPWRTVVASKKWRCWEYSDGISSRWNEVYGRSYCLVDSRYVGLRKTLCTYPFQKVNMPDKPNMVDRVEEQAQERTCQTIYQLIIYLPLSSCRRQT